MNLGKLLIILGTIILVAGLIIQSGIKIPFFGKLPGDIRIERENFTFYFPLASSIIVSVILTLIIYLVNKFRQ